MSSEEEDAISEMSPSTVLNKPIPAEECAVGYVCLVIHNLICFVH